MFTAACSTKQVCQFSSAAAAHGQSSAIPDKQYSLLLKLCHHCNADSHVPNELNNKAVQPAPTLHVGRMRIPRIGISNSASLQACFMMACTLELLYATIFPPNMPCRAPEIEPQIELVCTTARVCFFLNRGKK